MEEADKGWMMIRLVGGWMFLLVLAHPGSPSPRQRAVKRMLLLLLMLIVCLWCTHTNANRPKLVLGMHTELSC